MSGATEGKSVNTVDKLDMREIHLLAAARELVDVLHRWNRLDLPELVIEDSRKQTPYYHLTSALLKILGELGITPDEKMDFYDMVTTGMAPSEARQRILDHRPQDDGEDGE